MRYCKRTFCQLLLVLLLPMLSGCFFRLSGDESASSGKLPDPQVASFLEALQENDAEKAYDLMFPGVMEEDVFREAMKQLRSNCPWEEKYTVEQLQRSVISTIGTGGSSKTYTAQYRLEFESGTYSLSVQYMEKGEERGFMSFQINLQSLTGSGDTV